MAFDLDGTLFDHLGSATTALRSWLGAAWTPEVETAWFAAEERHHRA